MSDIIIEKSNLEGVIFLTPKSFKDSRGFFEETFVARDFSKIGISNPFLQDNQSYSLETGVVRGLHFQIPPHSQGKLVRVLNGSIFDVAVDIRKSSPTYGQHISVLLSAQNRKQAWIPQGFAHGFCTLEPNTEVLYKVTDYYAKDCERGLFWNDPDLKINWPISSAQAILSEKDKGLPKLSTLPSYFK